MISPKLRLIAAEDQATAAAAPLLASLDVTRATDRELTAARLTLGGAKLAIRRVAYAHGRTVDREDRGRPLDADALARLRPYTVLLERIKQEEEYRQADAGRRYRETRAVKTAPAAHAL